MAGQLALLAAGAMAGAPAWGLTSQPLVLEGDVAPGTGGSLYESFDAPAVNDAGDVAFLASYTAPPLVTGLFLIDSGGSDQPVALEASVAPGTSGGTFSGVHDPAINDSSQVAFHAFVSGGSVGEGIFVWEGPGLLSARVLPAQTAPGTGGGAYLSLSNVGSLDSIGAVSFAASITGGTASWGVFVASDSTTTARALSGQSAPGTGGGSYFDFGAPALNDAGDIAFFADYLVGPDLFQGLFAIDSVGAGTALALEGQTAPASGGGTYSGSFGNPVLNDAGMGAFIGSVSGGSTPGGLFRFDAMGNVTAGALFGDAAPGSHGGTFAGFGPPAIDEAGEITFFASIDGGTGGSGIFLVNGLGGVSLVVRSGTPAPGTGGGSYGDPVGPMQHDTSGLVAFEAPVVEGATTEGLFALSTATPIPALTPTGRLTLALLVVATASLAGFIRRRGQLPGDS